MFIMGTNSPYATLIILHCFPTAHRTRLLQFQVNVALFLKDVLHTINVLEFLP